MAEYASLSSSTVFRHVKWRVFWSVVLGFRVLSSNSLVIFPEICCTTKLNKLSYAVILVGIISYRFREYLTFLLCLSQTETYDEQKTLTFM